MAVCPQQLPIAFKLGLAAKRSLRFGPLTRYSAFRNWCASTTIASLYFSLALWPSAISILWTAYRPPCTACSDFPIAFQPGLTAKHGFYPSARSPPALRGASACLNYSNCYAYSLYLAASSRLLSDYFAIRAMAVCPHSDCIIAFQLGLLRPSADSNL